ncbi:MAG: hypothetical protein AABX05_04910 [Nanoarchaeota archaeon]
MANIATEMAKRITLIDLVQDVKKAKEVSGNIKDPLTRTTFDSHYLVRTLNRGLIRIIGDLSAAGLGYAASLDTEQLPRYVAAAVGAFAGAYLFDHLVYDRLHPADWKKKDSK